MLLPGSVLPLTLPCFTHLRCCRYSLLPVRSADVTVPVQQPCLCSSDAGRPFVFACCIYPMPLCPFPHVICFAHLCPHPLILARSVAFCSCASHFAGYIDSACYSVLPAPYPTYRYPHTALLLVGLVYSPLLLYAAGPLPQYFMQRSAPVVCTPVVVWRVPAVFQQRLPACTHSVVLAVRLHTRMVDSLPAVFSFVDSGSGWDLPQLA